jgi:hypothetical protein
MIDRNEISDAVAAEAFWRLVDHLRHRSDAQNVDLMGLAGFCRNCLSDWLEEGANAAGLPMSKGEAREAIYGMTYEEWKQNHQSPASADQLARMEASVRRNRRA